MCASSTQTETIPNPTPVTIPTDAIIETAGSSKDNEKEASCEGPKEKNVRRSKRQELKKKDEKTTCDKCGKEVFEGKKNEGLVARMSSTHVQLLGAFCMRWHCFTFCK